MTLVAVSMIVFGGLLILSAWEDQSITKTVGDVLAGNFVPKPKMPATTTPGVKAPPGAPFHNPGSTFL